MAKIYNKRYAATDDIDASASICPVVLYNQGIRSGANLIVMPTYALYYLIAICHCWKNI